MALLNLNPKSQPGAKSNANSAGLWPYVFILPTFLVMGLITFYPIYFNFNIAFTDFGLVNMRPDNPPNWVGFNNFIGILGSDIATVKINDFYFLRHLFFNVWWAVSSVFTTMAAGIFIAIVLNTDGLYFKRFYRLLFILPMVVPALVVNTVWRNMFDAENGAINLGLMAIGSVFGVAPESLQINWLGSVDHPIPFLFPGDVKSDTRVIYPLPVTYYAMMLSNFWRGWPWVVVVATGALQSISKDMYEAAEIDGASWLQRHWAITLPLLKPAMIPAAIGSYNWTFNMLDIPYFLTSGAPFRETELLVSILFRLINEQRLYGVAAAMGVIIFFVSLFMFVLTNRITKATESYDG